MGSEKLMRRYSLFFILILSMLTGCLRSAGDSLEGLEARALSTTTPTFTPQQVVDTVIITATLDPNATADQDPVVITTTPIDTPTPLVITATPDPLQVAQAVTETPRPGQLTRTQEALDAASFAAQNEQDLPTPSDPLMQQATQIIQTATQQSIFATETALGPQIEFPTFTPTPDPGLAPVPTATNQPAIGGPNCVHEVRAGETLYRLSVLYGVPVMDMATASGISNIQLILVGQRVTIPNCGTTGAFPPPTTVPTAAVDTTFGTGGPATSVPSAGGVQHVVQQGETLFQISLRYGVPVNTIAAANGIANPNLITMTDVLIIP